MNKTIMIAAISVALIAGTLMASTLVEAETEKPKFENLKAVVIEWNDDKEGNDLGWNPDGSTTTFSLFEAEINFMAGPIPMSYNLIEPSGSFTHSKCYAPVKTSDGRGNEFVVISCETPPPNGTSLKLIIWIPE